MGGPCSNILCTSSLLPLYLWGPTFHDTAFSTLFVDMEPDILSFKIQPVLGILSSIVELNSTQRFHPVRIGARLACFFRAYVPVNPNMFSANDPNSIKSLLSKFCIQDPMFVLRARKNSTIIFQECLGAWVRHCLCVSPSGMASQSSSSESQSLLVSWRLLIRGNMRNRSGRTSGVSLIGSWAVEPPEVPRLFSDRTNSSTVSAASVFRNMQSDRSAGAHV